LKQFIASVHGAFDLNDRVGGHHAQHRGMGLSCLGGHATAPLSVPVLLNELVLPARFPGRLGRQRASLSRDARRRSSWSAPLVPGAAV
jgi:hypothetical protein